MAAAGLTTASYHNHVPTMGELGWVLGMRGRDGTRPVPERDRAGLRQRLAALTFETLDTRFVNRDAMVSMLHFGKGFDDAVDVSDETNFAIFYYYRDGDWELN